VAFRFQGPRELNQPIRFHKPLHLAAGHEQWRLTRGEE
jgi:hypothetical protein